MNIEELKRKLLVKYPFFGSIITDVEYKEASFIPTAATDGQKILYNEEFMKSKTLDEQVFILAHEVCHIVFEHAKRGEDKEHTLWNIATDAVINQLLQKDGLTILDGAINIPEAISYDAESYYKKLLKEKEENTEEFDMIMKQTNGGQGHDSHEEWQNEDSKENNQNNKKDKKKKKSKKERQKEKREKQKNGNNKDSKEKEKDQTDSGLSNSKEANDKSQSGKPLNDDKEESRDGKPSDEEKKSGGNSSKVEETKKEATDLGEPESFEKNKDKKKELLKKIKQELQDNMSKQAGDSTNEDVLEVKNIGFAQPIIDWRYLLKETINLRVDWTYENATIENGVITPNLEYNPFAETEIVLDTSGSIDENLLKGFLRECKNITETSTLKVGCFDTKFYGFTEIRTDEDIDDMVFQGGGGTDFDVAVNAFTERVANKIVFTDGYADMPKKEVDAIWVVFYETSDRFEKTHLPNISPKGGTVIYVNYNDLVDRYMKYQEQQLKRTLD